MLKKIATLTLVMFLLVAFSNVLVAQEPKTKLSEADIQELAQYAPMFEGQTAMTETEIKTYAKLLPELIAANSDEAKIQSLIADNNFEPIRFIYISIKLPIAISINEDTKLWEGTADKLPEVLKPSKEEVTLAVKYMADIGKTATN